MKLERIKKDKKKNIIIGSMVVLSVVGCLTITTTRSKYRNVQNLKLASGTVNYKASDLHIVAIKTSEDGINYNDHSGIPTVGYMLNTTLSKCRIPNSSLTGENSPVDENITIEYMDGKLNILGLTKKNTKCYLYFDKLNSMSVDDLLASLEKSARSDYTDTFTDDTTGTIFETLDDYGTSYYYAGKVENNWVKFAGFYWRIIRFNGNKTIRLIYSGTEESGPVVSGPDSQIGTTQYNDDNLWNSQVGYMYGKKAPVIDGGRSSDMSYSWMYDDMFYGTSYTYDSATATYKLAGTVTTGQVKTSQYTCFSRDRNASCRQLLYVVNLRSTSSDGINSYNCYYYFPKESGSSSYAETHQNDNDSLIKQKVDNWYEINILNTDYAKNIDGNTGFCGDRSVANGTGAGLSDTTYASYKRMRDHTPTLKCSNKNDLYTMPNSSSLGNEKLKYPVGLINVDEVMFAGGLLNKDNTDYYLHTNSFYWTMSPTWYYYPARGAQVHYVGSSGDIYNPYNGSVTTNWGIRPVINLRSDIVFNAGSDGTQNNPYIVQ